MKKKFEILTNINLFIILLIIIIAIIIINKIFFNIENFYDDVSVAPILSDDIHKVYNKNDFENKLINTINPYDDDKETILWPDLEKNIFMQLNWPNNFDFDYEIKKDIIDKALKLKENYCIIDCGAHVGDGVFPIAHILKKKRNDIKIYAIEPSKHKCDFINYIKEINNFDNIIVLNMGLSDIIGNYLTPGNNSNNTGAWNWFKEEFTNIDKSYFDSIDNLVKNNIISDKLGIIHLDVEGMERNVLKGAKKTIENIKPYLSLENHNEEDIYIDLLPNKYELKYKLHQNSIYIYNEN